MLDLTTPQTAPVVEEEFQRRIIAGMTRHLLHHDPRPCLLRAPTGSGKTFMMARVLEQVSEQQPTLWLWFAPFVNLVQQTLDAIAANCPHLKPYLLATERQFDHANGHVLIANVQQVASKTQQRQIYQPTQEQIPTLDALIARARARNLQIGIVVDEAHIGVDNETEFGKFCKRLKPDTLILATATPKDDKLNQFVSSSGFREMESFPVGRDEVVSAHLNKRYINAYVYRVNESWATVADLRKAVLKQAWEKHRALKQRLNECGIPLTPLLLVQVANGKDTTKEALEALVSHCKVPAHVIGEHSADDPNPELLAAIAYDPVKEVLIFKESAGTGFDAPRAFILASAKAVSDADFATQFIGRVMRVDRQVRQYLLHDDLPPDLDTAYLYLANAEAQAGFQQVITDQIKTALENRTEKLVARTGRDGSIKFTNRVISQPSLTPRAFDPDPPEDTIAEDHPSDAVATPRFQQRDLPLGSPPAHSTALPQKTAKPIFPAVFGSREELIGAFNRAGIAVYPLRAGLPCFSPILKTERRPTISSLDAIALSVAEKLDYTPDQLKQAVDAACDRIAAREIATELTEERTLSEQHVKVALDRNQLAREVERFLNSLPQVEEADIATLTRVLSKRLQPELSDYFSHWPEDSQPNESQFRQALRDTTHWIIRQLQPDIAEAFNRELAAQALLADTSLPLPDAMIFPTAIPLSPSAKNLYGVLPPQASDFPRVEQVLLVDERRWLADKPYRLSDSAIFRIGYYSANLGMNEEEKHFAKALDEADFVLWWHRNPDRKPYSVAVVRADSTGYFYPDFVVCVEYYPGAEPRQRLIETKESLKDAYKKARHIPGHYGKVIFLTQYDDRLRVIHEDGSLGEFIDPELTRLREKLRQTG
ncbi:MAG: DEAD/DEAH box helicase family protein [Candidatus Contendobacter sp.]